MKVLKFIVKIILSPVILSLTIIEHFAEFLINTATLVLSIISFVCFITAIFAYFNDGARAGITISVLSWLLSPFGIPAIAQFIIQLVSVIKNKLINI